MGLFGKSKAAKAKAKQKSVSVPASSSSAAAPVSPRVHLAPPSFPSIEQEQEPEPELLLDMSNDIVNRSEDIDEFCSVAESMDETGSGALDAHALEVVLEYFHIQDATTESILGGQDKISIADLACWYLDYLGKRQSEKHLYDQTSDTVYEQTTATDVMMGNFSSLLPQAIPPAAHADGGYGNTTSNLRESSHFQDSSMSDEPSFNDSLTNRPLMAAMAMMDDDDDEFDHSFDFNEGGEASPTPCVVHTVEVQQLSSQGPTPRSNLEAAGEESAAQTSQAEAPPPEPKGTPVTNQVTQEPGTSSDEFDFSMTLEDEAELQARVEAERALLGNIDDVGAGPKGDVDAPERAEVDTDKHDMSDAAESAAMKTLLGETKDGISRKLSDEEASAAAERLLLGNVNEMGTTPTDNEADLRNREAVGEEGLEDVSTKSAEDAARAVLLGDTGSVSQMGAAQMSPAPRGLSPAPVITALSEEDEHLSNEGGVVGEDSDDFWNMEAVVDGETDGGTQSFVKESGLAPETTVEQGGEEERSDGQPKLGRKRSSFKFEEYFNEIINPDEKNDTKVEGAPGEMGVTENKQAEGQPALDDPPSFRFKEFLEVDQLQSPSPAETLQKKDSPGFDDFWFGQNPEAPALPAGEALTDASSTKTSDTSRSPRKTPRRSLSINIPAEDTQKKEIKPLHTDGLEKKNSFTYEKIEDESLSWEQDRELKMPPSPRVGGGTPRQPSTGRLSLRRRSSELDVLLENEATIEQSERESEKLKLQLKLLEEQVQAEKENSSIMEDLLKVERETIAVETEKHMSEMSHLRAEHEAHVLELVANHEKALEEERLKAVDETKAKYETLLEDKTKEIANHEKALEEERLKAVDETKAKYETLLEDKTKEIEHNIKREEAARSSDVQRMQDEVNAITAERDELLKQLRPLQGQVERLHKDQAEKTKAFLKEKAMLEQMLDSIRVGCRAAQLQLSKTEQSEEALRTELEDMKTKCGSLEEGLREAKDNLVEKENEIAALVEADSSISQTLQKRIDDLEDTVSVLKRALGSAEEAVKRKEMESTNKDIEYKAALEEKEKEVSQKDEALEEQYEVLSEKEDRIAELLEEKQNLSDQVESARCTVIEAQKEVVEANRQLEDEMRRRRENEESAQSTKESLDVEMARLVAEMKALEEKGTQLTSALDEAQSDAESVRQGLIEKELDIQVIGHERNKLAETIRDLAAKRIQLFYRRKAAKREYRRRKEARMARERDIAEARRLERRAQEEKSAVVIQRVYRGHRVRGKAWVEKRKRERENAVVCIQRSYRGHQSRKEVAAIRREKQRAADEHVAAVKIQRIHRGRQARKEVQAKFMDRVMEGVIHLDTTAAGAVILCSSCRKCPIMHGAGSSVCRCCLLGPQRRGGKCLKVLEELLRSNMESSDTNTVSHLAGELVATYLFFAQDSSLGDVNAMMFEMLGKAKIFTDRDGLAIPGKSELRACVYDSIAQYYWQKGDYKSARDRLVRALTWCPKTPNTLSGKVSMHLSAVLLMAGSPDYAAEYARSAVTTLHRVVGQMTSDVRDLLLESGNRLTPEITSAVSRLKSTSCIYAASCANAAAVYLRSDPERARQHCKKAFSIAKKSFCVEHEWMNNMSTIFNGVAEGRTDNISRTDLIWPITLPRHLAHTDPPVFFTKACSACSLSGLGPPKYSVRREPEVAESPSRRKTPNKSRSRLGGDLIYSKISPVKAAPVSYSASPSRHLKFQSPKRQGFPPV